MTNWRFGLGWRPQLSAGIFSNLDRIDVVEVIADDYFHAAPHATGALRTLGSHVPLQLHGVSMGMASTSPVDTAHLDAMARLIEQVRPEMWSEHLAFVRGGGIEIGHLAMPPRNNATLNGALENIRRATRHIGIAPAMENIATLLEPPGSTLPEADWLAAITRDMPGGLLLDLHNVHTNAVNLGYPAAQLLNALPLHRVTNIHLAGGKPLKGRILDDHLHDVPDPVYALLAMVAQRITHPVTVILERDGAYPPIAELLAQLDRARAVVSQATTHDHARL